MNPVREHIESSASPSTGFSNGVKLLVITQAVDTDDPVLGFFVRWLQEFAQHAEHIEVICLKEGEHVLPANVRVHSLGKEMGRRRRFIYAMRFKWLIWKLRHNYDAVFVHMNQEYILLGGAIWALLRKRVYMWRNHHAGSFATDIAALFCRKVFYTSNYSYTASYRRSVRMPVGIDTTLFTPHKSLSRNKRSVLMLGRIAPSKRQDLLVEALARLSSEQVAYTATIVGDPLLKDVKYLEQMQKRVATEQLPVTFYPGVPNTQTPLLYATHEVCVNASSSGMYDKTIFEAMACECVVLVSNKNLEGVLDPRCLFAEGNAKELAEKLSILLALRARERAALAREERALVVEHHSLTKLAEKLFREL